jgi:MYXO-CTERM domain-containing protein
MRFLHSVLFLLTACFAALTPAAAQVTFSFNYTDQSGAGFNHATLGAVRRGALEAAASSLAQTFTGYGPRTVVVSIGSVSGGVSYAAFAADEFGPAAAGFQQSSGQSAIQQGLQNGAASITWNFDADLAWDYDDSVSFSAYNFKSIAMHELLHTLGVSSSLRAGGIGALGSLSGNVDKWTGFDRFLTDASGVRLIDDTGRFNTALASLLSDGVAGDVFFSGANAVAANGGQLVSLYSPATFIEGSSFSHLNPLVFDNTENFSYLLVPSAFTGPAPRSLSAVEVGILTDLGYNLAAIPEPAETALALGLAGILWAWRRRRS